MLSSLGQVRGPRRFTRLSKRRLAQADPQQDRGGLPLRQEFGGLKTEQVKRLKDLELENSRLRKAVSDLTWISSFCRRPPGETSKPRASPCLH